MTRLLAGLVLALTASAVIQAGPAHAEVSARCYAHLAEHPGTTPAADRRFHLEHGEFSPCTEQDANESEHRDEHHDEIHRPHVGGDDDHKDDDKSRYCRKRWFC
ncbi:hypothetical protein SEA_ACOLYTE_77 [Mycobacterium phage Acolyte]|nr:hypothetical protein SEA_ACOLYTE_77 [Mycobacterium phage Acolyte]